MRVAVVGLGMMGQLHSRVLLSEPGVEAVIGVETDPDRAAEVSAELALEVRPDLESVLPEVDAVSITLPDDLHLPAALLALAAGKYVLVEKPLATTAADCEAILAAQPLPGRLMVGHVLRFDERLRELKRRIDAGVFGKLRYVRIHRVNTRATAERVAARASVTAFLGVHDLDLLLWLTGEEIESAKAAGRRVFGAYSDVTVATLDLSAGTLAVLENHWLLHPSSARSCLAGVQVFGDEGSALIDLSTDELELITDDDHRSVRIDTRNWTHDPLVSGGSLRRELASFIRSATTGAPVEVSGEDGLRAVRAVELVEAAATAETE
ncbi:Gfo/Idh/MocA family protein [Microlunatus speluncae]|uniref:Gfo/Idh/MocA family protein n=1 Tax=Microlunatus speluncae TaxID=2594267 RepID=UPI001266101C|nr:Gfo/Idh/MocA family oxidoreductase [Microlunatus speluncae]